MSPAPAALASFFQDVAQGGPTAAASVFQSLSWIAKNFGVQWPLQHFLVSPYKSVCCEHRACQADELEPWEFLNLLLLALELTGPGRVIAAFVIQSAVSCIRFAHIQRSRLVQAHPDWLEFECSVGKSKRGGVRPPYRWACPEIRQGDFSLKNTLLQFQEEVAHPQARFLWPAVQLSQDNLWQIVEETPFLVHKSMSRSRFMECFRGLLIRAGLPPARAYTAHYNRLRRFMPTAGMVYDAPPADAQSIGSWTENIQSAKPQSQKLTMSVHYAGERVARSAKVKLELLAKLRRTYRLKAADYASQSSLLKPDSFTWAEVSQSQVQRASRKGAAQKASSSSSSSSSDFSEGSASENAAAPQACEGMEWFQDKYHLTREKDEHVRSVPWCRTAAFPQDPTQQGVGLTSVPLSKYCSKCLARAPRYVKQAVRELSL